VQDATNFLLKLSQDLPPDQATKARHRLAPRPLRPAPAARPWTGTCVWVCARARACVRASVWRVSGGYFSPRGI
jgi:hypothetical protein